MDAATDIRSAHPGAGRIGALGNEALYLAAGIAVTFCLFAAMARFEGAGKAAPDPQIDDLKSVSALYEPPPPAVQEHPQQQEEVMPFAGLDIGVSDSPVRIAVVPPDLAKIIPTTEIPPRADVRFDQLYTDLKPKSGLSGGAERVYRPSEVDKAPTAIVKTIAHVSRRARDDADELRTTLELVIKADGDIESVRVMRSSGNPEFDTIVMHGVRREWVFSPAIKGGKNVKCLVNQLIWYKWSAGGPFKI